MLFFLEINGHNFKNVEKGSAVEEATQDNQNKDDANIESVATTRNSRHQQTNSKRNSAFVGKSSPVTKNGDYNFR